MAAAQTANAYLLGHADEELVRLERQAILFAEGTEQILKKAGMRAGMRVLDLGCGPGDVSMLAARLVGKDGQVVGLDRSEHALALAARRAEAKGLSQLSFLKKDLAELAAEEKFDMVVGRFLLLHFPDPVTLIHGAASVVKKGGVVAFAEMDIRSTVAEPAFPALERCVGWIVSMYQRAGLEPDMGAKLAPTFELAGLTAKITSSVRTERGLGGGGLDYLIGALHTMKPNFIALGVATEAELDIPEISRQLARGMADGDRTVSYPRLVGAWAQV